MTDNVKLSPLHSQHEALGATFTLFGAWNMPLKYGNELDEHRAVREAVGLFDLSHMGEFHVTGDDAGAYLDYTLVSDISSLPVGKAKYSMLCKADGGILDDLITYKLGDNEYLVIPNAANIDKDFAAFQERTENFQVSVANESFDTALLALQGPRAEEILLGLVPDTEHSVITDMGYYECGTATVAGLTLLIARTGYTGEDGFELYVPNDAAPTLWETLLHAGEKYGIRPCGLAARDSLRLEAAMPLYGNELSEDLTPKDAGMGFLVGKNKDNFVGKEAIAQQEPPARLLRGLTGEGRRAARHGAVVYSGEQEIGVVTSGAPSPTLKYPIALAYIDREFTEPGTQVEADIRGKRYPFTVTKGAFYQRKK